MSDANYGSLMAQVHSGNCGARNVCFEIFDSYDFSESENIFKACINKKIIGSQLWSLYKDKHQKNIGNMVVEILGSSQ